MASAVKLVKDMADFKKILKEAGDKLVVVDFYATWCGPCKMISPVLDELSKNKSNVVFLKVDVDEAEDIAQEYQISAMPTFKCFKNGEQVEELMGANKDKLKEMVEKLSS